MLDGMPDALPNAMPDPQCTYERTDERTNEEPPTNRRNLDLSLRAGAHAADSEMAGLRSERCPHVAEHGSRHEDEDCPCLD